MNLRVFWIQTWTRYLIYFTAGNAWRRWFHSFHFISTTRTGGITSSKLNHNPAVLISAEEEETTNSLPLRDQGLKNFAANKFATTAKPPSTNSGSSTASQPPPKVIN